MSAGKVFKLRRGMTAVPNATVYDSRLSITALGLLTLALARPDGAPGGYRAFEGRGLGESALRSAMKELDAAGYRFQVKTRVNGRFVTHTVFSEYPTTQDAADDLVLGEPLFDRAETPENPVDNSGSPRPEYQARSDLGKHGVSAGGTVPGLPRLGSPRHGNPRHISKDIQVSSTNARARARKGAHATLTFQEIQRRHDRGAWPSCTHGDPEYFHPVNLVWMCPLCRAEQRPAPGGPPWDSNAQVIDFAKRAAGEHQEVAR